ncbi:AraC family transcriptional regulator [Alkalicaulis satelles]|uniref:AraC family transcriptional regulator n=2 Tax=Alkalicaulis satelles TaxID=2609175 RepID=A0A5M6ZNR3_9PROT|nr:AraC family transcriptional regulator [Alkalicaulis satelles]
MIANAVFRTWTHEASRAEAAPVFPDGCRDVLIIRQPGERVRVELTRLDLRPRHVALPAGVRLTGYRLRPGAGLSERVLKAVSASPGDAEAILHNEAPAPGELDEIIHALTAPGATPGSVARELGVSARSVQRRLRALHLPPPDYWRLLARARHAASCLKTMALSDAAFESGFSDQAHMTREFVRWFGVTPARARRHALVLDLLCQPALGNWTGEQISTR